MGRANEWLDGVLITKLWCCLPPRATIIVRVGHPFTPNPLYGGEPSSIQSLALSTFLFSGLGQLFGTICLCDLGSFLVIIPISLFVWSDMNRAIIPKSITSNVVSKLNTYSHYDIILRAFKRVVTVIGNEKLSLAIRQFDGQSALLPILDMWLICSLIYSYWQGEVIISVLMTHV